MSNTRKNNSFSLIFFLPVLIAATAAAAFNFISLQSLNHAQHSANLRHEEDLQSVETAMEISHRMLLLHAMVSNTLKQGLAGKIDSGGVYLVHSKVVDELSALNKKIQLLTSSLKRLDIPVKDSEIEIDDFNAYRQFIIRATDMVSVEPKLASRYLNDAASHYIVFASHAQKINLELNRQTHELRKQTERDLELHVRQSLIVGIAVLLSMLLIWWWATRRMSKSFELISDSLSSLANHGAEYPLPEGVEKISSGRTGLIAEMAKAVISFRDTILERNKNQTQLAHNAHYDELTSLPNRVLLADRLQQAMVQCQRRKNMLAVIYLDLDGFKEVNDTYGHEFGDELLIFIKQRLLSVLRAGDTLARTGGDEFVAILVNIEQPQDCEPVLNRLLLATSDTISILDQSLNISTSIGVTFFPSDGVDADQLIRHANEAMYQAKRSGKNRFQLFDVVQDNHLKQQHEKLLQIAHAIKNNEFVLYYQPKVNMRTGEIIGVEALIRWQHPEKGLLQPGHFLPSIENNALSIDLDEWVINSALTQLGEWHTSGLNISVAVNITALNLQRTDFISRICISLDNHPSAPPELLDIEVLESSVLNDLASVSDIMTQCSTMGIKFSLDDFGTGYSSLTYLRALPAHTLKIDQSFIRHITENSNDRAIVQGVMGLANAFNRVVIAEGVETVEHGELLLKMGIHFAQGYGIARPMPASDLQTWIKSWRPDQRWTT